jgi:hypothetical protein
MRNGKEERSALRLFHHVSVDLTLSHESPHDDDIDKILLLCFSLSFRWLP